MEETYFKLLPLLADAGLVYLHIVDHAAMGAPVVPTAFKQALRKAWPRTFFIGGSFDQASGQQAVNEGLVDLIGLGRAFLANPDLVQRFQKGQALKPKSGEIVSLLGALNQQRAIASGSRVGYSIDIAGYQNYMRVLNVLKEEAAKSPPAEAPPAGGGPGKGS